MVNLCDVEVLPEILSDLAIDAAIRASGGSLESAISQVVAHARQGLRDRRDEFIQLEIRDLNAKLLALFGRDRVLFIRSRSQQLRDIPNCLHDEPLEDRIKDALRAYVQDEALATKYPEFIEVARQSRRDYIRLCAVRQLIPDLVELYTNIANHVDDLARQAVQDTQVIVATFNALHERISNRQQPENVLPTKYPERRGQVQKAIEDEIRDAFRIPVGQISQLPPPQLLAHLSQRAVGYLLAEPTLRDVISENDLVTFLRGLPLRSGVDPAYWHLIPSPLVFIEAPKNLELPLEACSVQPAVFETDVPTSLRARVFKFIPLRAIERFSEWLQADQAVRELHNGLVLHSAEPHKAAEQDALLYASVRMQEMTNDGQLPKMDSALAEVHGDDSPSGIPDHHRE